MIYLVTHNQQLFGNDLYTIVNEEESLKLLESLTEVGTDTETSGINVHLKDLLLVQLGCKEFQVVIDCRTVDIKYYKEFLESDRQFLFWNAKFDLKFFLKYGIVIKNIWDGYLAEKLLWLGYPSGYHGMSLKDAGLHYCNVELDKTVRGKIIWSRTLTDDIILYGAHDVMYLSDIKNGQIKELTEKGLMKAIAYENKFCPVLAYTEFCGVKLDETKWKAKMESDKIRFDEALGALNKWVVDFYLSHNGTDNFVDIDFIYRVIYSDNTVEEFKPTCQYTAIGQPWSKDENYNEYRIQKIRVKYPYVYQELQGDLFLGFDTEPKCCINWSSPKQVIPFLELLGFNLETFDKKTKETKKSVGADVIKKQKHIQPELSNFYCAYKEAEKVVGTYGQNVLDQINSVTHRIHTNFNQLGTDTGKRITKFVVSLRFIYYICI